MKIVIKGKGGVTIKEAPFMDFDVIKDAEFFRIDGEKYWNKSYNIDFDKEEIIVYTTERKPESRMESVININPDARKDANELAKDISRQMRSNSTI